MKNTKLLVVSVLTLAIISWVGVIGSSAQNQSTALERGYRTGYSDGYNAGFNDITNNTPRDIQSKEDYQRAERSYNQVWGPIEDFRDGYQQGFEAGYNAAYDRQTFNSSIPASLKRRTVPGTQTTDSSTTVATQDDPPPAATTSDVQDDQASAPAVVSAPSSLPRNTVFLVELLSSLSTDATQMGDRFQARVIEPRQLDGATVQGRVTAVRRPGKVKGKAELQLAFETMRLADGRITPFNADVIEVVQLNGDGVATVDPEGGIRGKSSTKDDVAKVGAASGIGAIIGAIAGGGKGAAIGAVIGGGASTGVLMNQRGKDIRLEQGQQLRIRTSSDTQIAQVH